MLRSEIRGWQWAITYDNPKPANSSSMLKALRKLGKVTEVQTKTTVILAPKKNVTWRRVRKALAANLNPKTGSVLYVNLRTGKAFARSRSTNFKWKLAAG